MNPSSCVGENNLLCTHMSGRRSTASDRQALVVQFKAQLLTISAEDMQMMVTTPEFSVNCMLAVSINMETPVNGNVEARTAGTLERTGRHLGRSCRDDQAGRKAGLPLLIWIFVFTVALNAGVVLLVSS